MGIPIVGTLGKRIFGTRNERMVKRLLRIVDQRLGPPGALPVKPGPPLSFSSFCVRAARRAAGMPEVKPT